MAYVAGLVILIILLAAMIGGDEETEWLFTCPVCLKQVRLKNRAAAERRRKEHRCR